MLETEVFKARFCHQNNAFEKTKTRNIIKPQRGASLLLTPLLCSYLIF